MIPSPHQALADLAGRIGSRLIPELTNPYSGADAGLISLLMTMLSVEMESGVQRRMQDAAELQGIFAEAAHAPGAGARSAFCSSEPASLSLTEVTVWLDQGLALLIDLHAWSETSDRNLNTRIWSFLAAHTERHKFDF